MQQTSSIEIGQGEKGSGRLGLPLSSLKHGFMTTETVSSFATCSLGIQQFPLAISSNGAHAWNVKLTQIVLSPLELGSQQYMLIVDAF